MSITFFSSLRRKFLAISFVFFSFDENTSKGWIIKFLKKESKDKFWVVREPCSNQKTLSFSFHIFLSRYGAFCRWAPKETNRSDNPLEWTWNKRSYDRKSSNSLEVRLSVASNSLYFSSECCKCCCKKINTNSCIHCNDARKILYMTYFSSIHKFTRMPKMVI